MTLPPRKRQHIKRPNRSYRYEDKQHLNHVRKHKCSNPDCPNTLGIEAAHVRKGSIAGMGLKPDDWRAVSLCGPCHRRQHSVGEVTFWMGIDVEALIAEFCRTSPKAREIAAAKGERRGMR